jgi:uncharacterized repeat protein (TIGR02543 family)
MFYNRMKKLPFVMLTLLVLAACGNNNSSIAPSSSSIRPSTSITTSSSSTSSSSETNDERYAIYVKAQAAGFTGTYQEWLNSIKGADGTSLLNGTTNPTSSQGKNGDTYINTSTWDVYVKSGGNWTKVGNILGTKGVDGQDGADGEDGLSAYEIYIANYPDYQGDEEQWLEDLINGNLAEVQTFIVTFDSNGGTSVPSQQVKRLDKVTKPLDPTKTGYTFDGWYIGAERWVFSGYNVTENITLTARWVEILEEGAGTAGLLYSTYIRNGKIEYAVSDYIGNESHIIIPPKVNGYEVTAIGRQAFFDDISIQLASVEPDPILSVTLPNNLVSIGAYAFALTDIKVVTLPDSLVTIDIGAFLQTKLETVNLGSNLVTIGDSAFYGTQLTSVVIPDSVAKIGNAAFIYSPLNSVTIGNSVTTIGKYAFQSSQLSSVTIPNSVTTIGEYAFANNQLTSVTIPNSLTGIVAGIFANNLLTSITIPNSVTTIGAYAFRNNPLTSVTIPNSVTTIGEYAFSSSQLTSVTIPNSVTAIGRNAFSSGQSFTIYVEATSKPNGWSSEWFSEIYQADEDFIVTQVTVIWDYKNQN